MRERGAALVIALVMLASLSLMASGAVQTALMELRMAQNTEEMSNAFQTAQAAIDYALADTSRLPMTGDLNLQQPVTLAGDPFALDSGAGERITTTAARTIDCGPPPRLDGGSSMLSYSAFSFRVAADIDRTSTGRGRSSIRQGYLVLGPKC